MSPSLTPEFPRIVELLKEVAAAPVGPHVVAESESTIRALENVLLREAFFRSLSVACPVGIFVSDSDGRAVYANPRILALFRAGWPEVEGLGWRRFLHADDAAALAEREAAINRGEPYHVRLRVRQPDGSDDWRWVEVRAAPLRVAGSGTLGYVGTVEDVTERLRQEERLRQGEALFRSVFESNPVGMAVVADDFRITAVNAALCAMTGHRGEELRGRRFTDLAHPDERDLDADLAQLMFQGASPCIAKEVRYLTKEGRARWGRLTAASLRGPGGQVRRLLGMLEDVTDRRESEARLVEANRALREVDAAKSEVLEMVAHDLRTPLTPMRVGVHLLRERHLAPEDDRTVAVIGRNLERMNTLVGQLLEMARLQRGRLPLSFARADLGEVVEEAAEPYLGVAARQGVGLAIAAPRGLVAEVDRQRIGQVVANLLSNALKFTPSGGEVRLTLRASGREALLEVEDTGAGFDPGRAGELFQPFHQLGAERREGTGLGLYICRGIVEQHGGRITGASDGPGRGARFTVRLPLAAASPSAA